MRIAFDVDGVLTTLPSMGGTEPNIPNIGLLKFLAMAPGVQIIVWSGRGETYAQKKAVEFGIDRFVYAYYSKSDKPHIDISFDDEVIDLADKNIRLNTIFTGE